MKQGWLIITNLLLVAALLGVMGCDNISPEEPEPINDSEAPQAPRASDFNLIFHYGVTARNQLDTFARTYTKDMVADPPITIPLTLSQEEMDSIYQKMVEIDFFSYPEKFSISVPPGEPMAIRTPYPSYYFKVEYQSRIKELWWPDEIAKEDEKADRLRELIKFIRDIVESKEAYQELPEPTSGYM